MARFGNITNGVNSPTDQAKYLSLHAHYYGFRESPDGSRERYYDFDGKGFVVTEYDSDNSVIIANVRTCSVNEVKLIMMAKNISFGD